MAKEYDYRANIIKLVGKDVEFVFNPIKVNNDTITRIATYDGNLVMYENGFKYDNEQGTIEMLESVFCVILTIRTEITERLLEVNKKLLELGGYDTKYYKADEWRKSFGTYNINHLKETLDDYELQLKRKKK